MIAASDRRLRLELACRCALALARREQDLVFEITEVGRSTGCARHSTWPTAGSAIVGFGPYPEWSADLALRVNSVPEAGGMMEGEHAFILDGQFCFVAGKPDPRAIGPISDARWVTAEIARPAART